MRTADIKFRGKRVDTLEWVYGFVGTRPDGAVFICPFENYESYAVIPETVGKYTGLNDKNGKEIYKGDILYGVAINNPAIVDWNNKFASFSLNAKGWLFSHWFGESCNPELTEIIGNIHDNPSLLNQQP